MQIPVLNGIYSDEKGDFRTAYPRNMIPVPKDQGISKGYLRPADGIAPFGVGPGDDRGGINWNGKCYRAMGDRLVRVESDGAVTDLGYIGPGGQVSFDYSFDRLAVASGGKLFYYNGSTLTQVGDPHLGTVIDMLWVDGYFMTTDGQYMVVTELTNPFVVNPFKYGSSEADPDPIMALLKLRDEVYTVNRNTIEVFNNVGGDFFPFQRVDGALIQRGAIGTFACAVFMEAIAFVGGGRNEAPAVWFGLNSQSTKISTREIEEILQQHTEAELSKIVVETRIDKGHQLLMIHLPEQCLVYDAAASQVAQEPVWFTLDSGNASRSTYRARNLVWCYDTWIVGDPTTKAIGFYSTDISSHYADKIGWEFGTMIIYNASASAIFHQLELVALTGRVPPGEDPTVWTQYSIDGETWSQPRPIKAGKMGERNKRLVWLQQGFMRNWRIQKFFGTSDCFISVARLEAQLEACNV